MPRSAVLTSVSAHRLSPLIPASPASVSFEGGMKLFQVIMSTEDFIALPRNPNQRNENLRNTAHLEILRPEHLGVQILVDRRVGSRVVKLNGHSRAKVWKENPSMAPDAVRVDVYELIDPALDFVAESHRLYTSFDSRRAVKTAAHEVQGSMSVLGVNFSTRWLEAGQFTQALKIAATALPKGGPTFKKDGIKALIEHFRPELEKLDNISPSRANFVGPFLAAAILMLRSDSGQSTVDMLADYSSGKNVMLINDQGNGQHWLAKYRKDGIDGKGRFPTGHGLDEKAMRQVMAHMIQARDNPNSLYDLREKIAKALNRSAVRAML